ncbi:MAG: arginine--tRNA ligase [Candidatus Brennerbacteria bacterium]|nr:arginine--tRNA ligase [Candidatus Brennerbacteria bacterium]
MLKAIIDLIKKSVKSDINFDVFAPENAVFGHYSTNVALRLAKIRKQPPLEIAEEIRVAVQAVAPQGFFEKIEIAAPGFINFWLSPQTLQNELKEILIKKERYGQSNVKGQMSKVLLEFLSANPTGPIHIGNGRGAFLGDALANILRFAGYAVKTEYYVNNARVSEQIKNLGKTAIGESDAYPYVGELYFKKNQALKKRLGKLSASEAGYALADHIQKLNSDFIKKKLKIKFNDFFEEESLFKSGEVEAGLKLLKKKKLTYEQDGALWFKAAGFGDSEDRVLVRSGGAPTYFLTDLAYHINKFLKRKFDKAINIWGADHHGYAPRLKFALKALAVKEERFEIIIAQFVRLVRGGKEVKMSKRKGDIETLEKLIDEVGLDAARFFFLAHTAGSHIDFDIKLARERSLKNPVYYVQYAYVRCLSILHKIKNQKSKIKNTNQNLKLKLLNTPEDIKLIRELTRFPEIVEDISKNYQVHNLVRYALELSRNFHNFYEKERVITDNKDLSQSRLALANGVLIVLKNTLELLGISLLEKM